MQIGLEDAAWLGLTLLAAGFFSAMDTALVGLPAARVTNAMEGKVRGASHLRLWLGRPAEVLTMLHLMRTSLLLTAAVLGVEIVSDVGLVLPRAILVMLLAILSLLISHLVPRAIAKRLPLEVACATMWFTTALTMVSWPIVWPLARIGSWVGRLVGVDDNVSTVFWTPDELGRISADAQARSLGAGGEDLLLSIIEFSDTVIREIMVPRTEMVALPMSATMQELEALVLEAGHSRIPIYDEIIDNVCGVLHVKDLFISRLQTKPQPDFKKLLRPTFYVPEVMKISELLREFQRRATHLAIVVDEYGGTAGVVTLEDIIEEIVGEIKDEYDVDEKQFRVLGDNKIIADARVSIWDIEEALGVSFPENEDYETLAGFLMSRAGALPATGTVLTWNNLRFTIKEADEKRIRTVEIERPSPARTA